MRSFWFDPYLWIHLAGLAALPLFLELCLAGFAVGNPLLPVWLELFLVAAAGIAPILWMQWARPFYIFSIVAIALKPEQLNEDQRRLLTLFKSQRHQILAVLVSIVLVIVLRQLYLIAPIAAPVAPFASEWRIAGLLLAALAFLGSNLFLQVPVSVASVMLTSESTFAATVPYPVEQIRSNFTLLGLQVNQILPPIIFDRPAQTPVTVTTPPLTETEVDPWDGEPVQIDRPSVETTVSATEPIVSAVSPSPAEEADTPAKEVEIVPADEQVDPASDLP